MCIGAFPASLLATAGGAGWWWQGCWWPSWGERWSAWRCGQGGKSHFRLCQTGEFGATAAVERTHVSVMPGAALGGALQTDWSMGPVGDELGDVLRLPGLLVAPEV